MRGFHICEFCKKDCGNGEIGIIHPDGRIFMAPVGIVHYLVEHSYKPPDDFIDAVLLAGWNGESMVRQ
jgi:hypothetical protein